MTPGRFRYGRHPSQVATLHLPDRGRPPVVCLLHGGFWTMPHGADQMTPLAEDLARRGYAAWNLEYRRIGDGGGYPATFDDVREGIAFLAAAELPVDPERVVAVGHSAGGHLALWAASRPEIAVRGACGQGPITDLAASARAGLGRGAVERFMGGSPDALPARYAAGTPAARSPAGRPLLVVHGEEDEVVPITMSRAFVAAADHAALHAIPHCGHFEHLDPSGAAWRVVVEWLDGVLHAPGGVPQPARSVR